MLSHMKSTKFLPRLSSHWIPKSSEQKTQHAGYYFGWQSSQTILFSFIVIEEFILSFITPILVVVKNWCFDLLVSDEKAIRILIDVLVP